ncbi:MAG: DMT family transporter [Pseudomonadota bacterium]
MQSLWMLFATFVFAIMAVAVKLASNLYSTSEIVMYRGLISVIVMFVLIRFQGGTLKTVLGWHHAWRGVVGVTALWLWFSAIALLPLATAMTLNYMSPIWIAAILFAAGWWQGKNRFEWSLAAAVALSFVGVICLLRPSIHSNQWLGGMLGLVSGVLTALAYIQVRKLSQMGEPEYRVVFYFSLTNIVAGLLGIFATALLSTIGAPSATPSLQPVLHSHSAYGLALLLGIGVSATVAQLAMTRAYRLGKMLITANLQYTGIVFSSFWGVLIWGDILDGFSWAGIAIILASGIVATFYNSRKTAESKSSANGNKLNKAMPPTDPITTEL